MTKNIEEIENLLRNVYLTEIVNYPRYIKQSTNDVWGNYVVRLHKNADDSYSEDRQKLESWYHTITIKDDTKIEDIVNDCKAFCQEKDNQGITSFEEGEQYTCHQLCYWQWLINENGKIVTKVKTPQGETVYQATLVKYAKILKDLE